MRIIAVVWMIFIAQVAQAQKQLSKEDYDSVTKQYTIEFRDATKLKRQLMTLFETNREAEYEGIEKLKKRFEISDELMRSIATEIYTDSSSTLKEKRTSGIVEGLDSYRVQVLGALFCLGLSADQSAKQMLLALVTDSSTESSFRQQAISSYLRAADAEEVKNFILRFLVEEGRMDDSSRSSIYVHAKKAWDDSSPEKKAAIFETLCIAASMESPHWIFEECDRRLIAMNSNYKDSLQRLSMLKRQLSIPFSKYYGELKTQMENEVKRLEKLKSYSNVSTNFAALKARNFNLPLPAGATNELTAPVPAPTEVEFTKVGDESKDPVSMKVVVIVLLLAVLGFSVWKTKKSKAP